MGDMAKMAKFASAKEFETVLDGLQSDARLRAAVEELRKKGAEHTRLNKAAALQFGDNEPLFREHVKLCWKRHGVHSACLEFDGPK